MEIHQRIGCSEGKVSSLTNPTSRRRIGDMETKLRAFYKWSHSRLGRFTTAEANCGIRWTLQETGWVSERI